MTLDTGIFFFLTKKLDLGFELKNSVSFPQKNSHIII